METKINALAQFVNNANINTSSKNTNSEYAWNLIFQGIKAGIINPQTMNLKSYNWIFADIQKMTESEFIGQKSRSDYHKKIRLFFQNLGGKNIPSSESKKLANDYFSALRSALNETNKK